MEEKAGVGGGCDGKLSKLGPFADQYLDWDTMLVSGEVSK